MTDSTQTEMAGLLGPNEEMLEAQARVCTGPTLTRPLGITPRDPDPERILSLLLASARNEMPGAEAVSTAQMGAFLTAMAIRRRFPAETAWSRQESAAFGRHADALETALPPAARFLLDTSIDLQPTTESDAVLFGALREVIAGRHLDYGPARRAARASLDPDADPILRAALLIGQRMNRETFDEFRGYADAVRAAEDALVVGVPNLLHIGEPYNGSTRFFKPTLFVAAVRAELGRATVLHGVHSLPPKSGITEEQILTALRAGTHLSLEDGASLLENENLGFVYVSQRVFAPKAFTASELRVHIKKRPPFAATEKAQLLYRTRADNAMIVGYYHPGYEGPHLRLMQERGMVAGAVIKGEEGSSQCGLRLGKASSLRDDSHGRKAVNHVQYFRRSGTGVVEDVVDIDPQDLGLRYETSPRLEPITAEHFAAAGMEALSGKPGHVYDRIALNVAVIDSTLGLEPDLQTAYQNARAVLESGRAARRLDAYIAASASKCSHSSNA